MIVNLLVGWVGGLSGVGLLFVGFYWLFCFGLDRFGLVIWCSSLSEVVGLFVFGCFVWWVWFDDLDLVVIAVFLGVLWVWLFGCCGWLLGVVVGMLFGLFRFDCLCVACCLGLGWMVGFVCYVCFVVVYCWLIFWVLLF